MRLIQFETVHAQRHVGVVEGDVIQVVSNTTHMRELALAAIGNQRSLSAEVIARGLHSYDERYAQLLEACRVLPPLDHEDPAHCLVSGTGLTHLGSASTRDKMHQQKIDDAAALTDTARIFQWGIEGGALPLAPSAYSLNGSTRVTVRSSCAQARPSRARPLPKMQARSLSWPGSMSSALMADPTGWASPSATSFPTT